MCVVAA
jgi:hypothetical protein